jgi:hypothetical protein
MIEEVAKVRNAELADDYPRAARAAWEAADQAWKVLMRCQDPWPLANQADGVARMFRLGEGIPGYAVNQATCLGLTPDARPLADLSRAAVELGVGVVAWLEERATQLEIPSEARDLIADGRAARYLETMRA